MREVWTNDFSYNIDVINTRPYGYPNTSYDWAVQERWYRDTNYEAEFGEIDYFQQRYTGFFVPPVDGVYTFNFISDDLMTLYLSTNSSRAHKKVIAYAPQWTRYRWDYFDSQLSSPISLKAGESYYIEAIQYNGYSVWSMGVGVKLHNLTWTDDFAFADHEQQIIQISSNVVKETQVSTIIILL